MTDEEMAEEYADRTRIVDENTRAGTDCISLVQDYEGNIIDIHERIKQAFLAGLKAGRPQWHDLRKDPTDLPQKMMSNPNFSIEVLSDKGEIVNYNFHFCEWYYWRRGKPIAWCEIPEYWE